MAETHTDTMRSGVLEGADALFMNQQSAESDAFQESPHGGVDPAAAQAKARKPMDLDFILDIPLEVSVEIGRARMLINDLLQLNPGSVIELAKLVGEPFEVLVNSKLVARGEVVVVNERFGVRLTDIISPMERIEQLR